VQLQGKAAEAEAAGAPAVRQRLAALAAARAAAAGDAARAAASGARAVQRAAAAELRVETARWHDWGLARELRGGFAMGCFRNAACDGGDGK